MQMLDSRRVYAKNYTANALDVITGRANMSSGQHCEDLANAGFEEQDHGEVVNYLIAEHDELWLKAEKMYREVEAMTKNINRLRAQITEVDPKYEYHDPIKLLFCGTYEDDDA
ncbi:MAG: hypothetical protein NUV63_12170 [Gallionella sp.]|nr:hypothetical protein [Gallionella sp.]